MDRFRQVFRRLDSPPISSVLCASEISDAVGQGYCQGGFSADFTKVNLPHLHDPGSWLRSVCPDFNGFGYRMAKWCLEDLAATSGKVGILF